VVLGFRIEPPRFFRKLIGLGYAARAGALRSIVARLGFGRWHVADRLGDASVVEPVHPLDGRVLGGFQRSPRAPAADGLGLEQPDHRLGECIVVGSTNAPGGRLDPVNLSLAREHRSDRRHFAIAHTLCPGVTMTT
jgi:hypothetical protein